MEDALAGLRRMVGEVGRSQVSAAALRRPPERPAVKEKAPVAAIKKGLPAPAAAAAKAKPQPPAKSDHPKAAKEVIPMDDDDFQDF